MSKHHKPHHADPIEPEPLEGAESSGVEALPPVGPNVDELKPSTSRSAGVEALPAHSHLPDADITADLDKLPASNDLAAIKANLAAGYYRATPGALAADLQGLTVEGEEASALRDRLAAQAGESREPPPEQ